MAHFRAEVTGDRGETSRQGSKKSGITSHIHGWNTGARVVAVFSEMLQKDVIRVYRTGGSNDQGGELVAKWLEGDQPPSFYK